MHSTLICSLPGWAVHESTDSMCVPVIGKESFRLSCSSTVIRELRQFHQPTLLGGGRLLLHGDGLPQIGDKSEDNALIHGNTHRGYIICGLDEPQPEKLYYYSVFGDTVPFASIVMVPPEVDEPRVGACGGSQGGGLTLTCVALMPSFNCAAPQMPFLSDYRRIGSRKEIVLYPDYPHNGYPDMDDDQLGYMLQM